MASFVKIAKIYTKVLEYACYAFSGSVYGETAPLTTVWGAILGALCKLYSWVTRTISAPASKQITSVTQSFEFLNV